MNYYWWESLDTQVGNVYGECIADVVTKVERSFNVSVAKVELLEENVSENRYTGKRFDV